MDSINLSFSIDRFSVFLIDVGTCFRKKKKKMHVLFEWWYVVMISCKDYYAIDLS